jgi:hypothetical protein
MSLKVEVTKEAATLENGRVRLQIEKTEGNLRERLFAFRDGWEPVLESRGSAGEAGLDFVPAARTIELVDRSDRTAAIRLTGGSTGQAFAVTIRLNDTDSFFQYEVEEVVQGTLRTRSLMSRYAFAENTVDFCFAPHLRPRHDHVVGQFAFKSPAIIVQRGGKLASLVADLDLIDASAQQLVCLEPDMSGHFSPEPTLAYGFKDHEPQGLIYFQHRPDMVAAIKDCRRSYGYRLYVSASAEQRYGYREIVRLLWALYGEKYFTRGLPQVMPIDRYNDYGLDYAVKNLWRELPRDGLECGGMVMGIKFLNDIWFHFFFNHLHTAFGLYRMGKRRGRLELLEMARKIRNLILTAPRNNGAFPAIYSHNIVTGIRQDEWIPHAHWVGGFIPYQTQIARPADQPAYSTMDGAWTAYWMLRWHEEIEVDQRLVEMSQAYGELLLRSQLPSGSVPVWLHKDTLEPLDALRENPSCAASGVLFAKLYESTKDARYRDAAKRVAAFVEERFMPQGWTDYETFFDSAGKPMDLTDPYSRQRPQCTFPIFWTAELGKLLYRTTKEEKYLEMALRAVDYLVLFQGVWSPPYLTVKGFGSIGIGNGHTGWNDARAGIFSPGIADFYELTGNVEYLQRSIAAMRAPLALMYVPENEAVSSVFDKGPLGYADECYAHRGRDGRLGPSTFDFSIGYALMAHEDLHLRFGSALLDIESGRGIGIDGCTVGAPVKSNGRIEFEVKDFVSHPRVITLSVAANGKGDDVDIVVNGKTVPRSSERQRLEIQV